MASLATIQAALVADASWAVKHEPAIHYTVATDPKVRPMPLQRWKQHITPLYTDCSGFVTCMYYRAGADDPNGRDYDGQGYTGTLLESGRRIPRDQLRVGDLVVYVKNDGSSVHVVMVTKLGADPTIVSHGFEGGPTLNTLSGENAWFAANEHAHPVYVRSLPDADLALHWRVVAGDGTTLGTTKHPVRWALRHPRSFRKRQSVRFIRKQM